MMLEEQVESLGLPGRQRYDWFGVVRSDVRRGPL
jgi:hypothetical protein